MSLLLHGADVVSFYRAEGNFLILCWILNLKKIFYPQGVNAVFVAFEVSQNGDGVLKRLRGFVYFF